jgi:hypothetical protein
MELHELAASQHQAFSAAQARSCGHTWRTIAQAVEAKVWREIIRGVFVERATWDGLDREGQHRCRVHGRLLVKQQAWAAARRSAAVMHGLPLIGFPPDRPQLLRDRGETRSRGHDRHERISRLPAEDVTVIDGVRTTVLQRTWADIAAEEAFRNAVVLADAVLRKGVTRDELFERATCSTARKAAVFAEPLAESALESISRVGFLTIAVPIPRPQVRVLYAGEEIARVDNLWDEFNTIGQADGALKYKDSSRVLRDKWQDERLESLGFEVVRWGWSDAWTPELLRGPLARGFERGSRQRLDPGVRLVQATLAESLQKWRRVA